MYETFCSSQCRVYSQSSKLLCENARVRLLLLLPHGALLSLWTYTARELRVSGAGSLSNLWHRIELRIYLTDEVNNLWRLWFQVVHII